LEAALGLSQTIFTPAIHSALPGMPFPATHEYYPTKDEMADYLQRYTRQFDLPVQLHRCADSLVLSNGGYRLSGSDKCYVAPHVVVAAGPYYTPRIPGFASQLDPPTVHQIHSSSYRSPDQLPAGAVLVVRAGNSGT
jgi:putative flavoprotein involved in K+ transport